MEEKPSLTHYIASGILLCLVLYYLCTLFIKQAEFRRNLKYGAFLNDGVGRMMCNFVTDM